MEVTDARLRQLLSPCGPLASKLQTGQTQAAKSEFRQESEGRSPSDLVQIPAPPPS
jgi:hypothetical protein